jgi:hypothetical protein
MEKLSLEQEIRLKCLEAVVHHKSSDHIMLQLVQIHHWIMTGESFAVFSSYPYLKNLKYNRKKIEFLLEDIKMQNYMHPESDLSEEYF